MIKSKTSKTMQICLNQLSAVRSHRLLVRQQNHCATHNQKEQKQSEKSVTLKNARRLHVTNLNVIQRVMNNSTRWICSANANLFVSHTQDEWKSFCHNVLFSLVPQKNYNSFWHVALERQPPQFNVVKMYCLNGAKAIFDGFFSENDVEEAAVKKIRLQN